MEYPPFQNAEHYGVTNSFTILVVNVSTLEAMGMMELGTPYLRGMYIPSKNLIVVPFSNEKDKDGQFMPDFEVLGHEVWHIVKGSYHN